MINREYQKKIEKLQYKLKFFHIRLFILYFKKLCNYESVKHKINKIIILFLNSLEMGIHCEINTYKTPDGYFEPGCTVSGILKYTITEETPYKKITLSLKGKGNIILKHRQRENNLQTHRKSEDYLNINYVIYRDINGAKLSVGTYQTQFNFELPHNIPASVAYSKKTIKYFLNLSIIYNIQIKFESISKRKAIYFCKVLNIGSTLLTSLPTEPTVYGDQKTFKKSLSMRKNVVKINAIIEKSFTAPGEKLNIDYEVNNDTSFSIRDVVASLEEVYTVKAKCNRAINITEVVVGTKVKKGRIKRGDIQKKTIEINIPPHISSIAYSNIVTREYFVVIKAEMSPSYDDFVLRIPVEIGAKIVDDKSGDPPEYWEVMIADDLDYRRQQLSESSDDEN